MKALALFLWGFGLGWGSVAADRMEEREHVRLALVLHSHADEALHRTAYKLRQSCDVGNRFRLMPFEGET